MGPALVEALDVTVSFPTDGGLLGRGRAMLLALPALVQRAPQRDHEQRDDDAATGPLEPTTEVSA